MKKITIILLSSLLFACGNGNKNNNCSQNETTSFQIINSQNQQIIYGTLNGLSGVGYNGNTKVSIQFYNNKEICADGNFTFNSINYNYKIRDCFFTLINSEKVLLGILYINQSPTDVLIKLDDSLYTKLNNIDTGDVYK